MRNNIAIGLLSVICFTAICFAAEREALVRLKVVDDAGKPAPSAKVSILFKAYQHGLETKVEAVTDEMGFVKAKGWPKSKFLHSVSAIFNESGYYRSYVNMRLGPEDREFDLNLLIRKKEDPIAMYAKKVALEIPEQRKEIGFDFEKGDWVKPYGRGEVADCTFIGEKAYEDQDNYRVTAIMSFTGAGAGMQPGIDANKGLFKQSAFKSSRTAPANGYKNTKEFVAKKSSEKGYDGTTLKSHYIFRARVNTGEDGEIISCHYGKLIDAVNLRFGAGKADTNPVVSFTYYFNPTPNDRNLEFEPKMNLFEDLKGLEEVNAP